MSKKTLKEVFELIPPDLLLLGKQIEETCLAAGINMNEFTLGLARLHFILGVLSTMCYVKEPEDFPGLKERLDEILIEILSGKR